jgi:hypothetical protein
MVVVIRKGKVSTQPLNFFILTTILKKNLTKTEMKKVTMIYSQHFFA